MITSIKERPILFSAPMVRAILADTKTQTRRIVKPQPPDGHEWHGFTKFSTCAADEGKAVWAIGESPLLRDAHRVRCPYGVDRLWVRETWQAWDSCSVECDEWEPWNVERRGGLSFNAYRDQHGKPDAIEYRATSESAGPWTPAIHMPRWASRITLEVTGVRVERLNAISEEDARAEGAPGYEEGTDAPPPDSDHEWSYRASFQRLWESINGPGSWAANPWVWAITFQRVQP